MNEAAVIVLAHGSRNDEETVGRMNEVLDKASFFLPRNVALFPAFLQFNRPHLEEALSACSSRNISRVFILPYFLNPGVHLSEDLPREVRRLKGSFPHLDIRLCGSLGSQSWFFDVVVRWLLDEIPDLGSMDWPNGETGLSGAEIKSKSFRFADGLCPSRTGLDEAGKKLMIRLMHTTGDPSLVARLRWSENALNAGVQALLGGTNIVTDVRMVKVGLDESLVSKLGCCVHCATEIATLSLPGGGTRASMGIEALTPFLADSVVAIGNSPTALLSVLRTAKEKEITPALVIGMPVGFVHALESKRLLMSSGLPYITVEGTRGGSPMAVATVNALMEMAVGKVPNESDVPSEPDETQKGGIQR